MGRMITFACPDGSEARGYLSESAGARAGVVVLQEWWGLNPQIEGVVEHFAVAGFTALAPDLYGGRVTTEPDEANHLMTGLDWTGATEVEIRVPFQGHFAARDDWCTPDAVDNFETAIGPSGVPQEIHRYEAAHGFFNETVAAYDAYSAAKSWQRTLAFLREHM